MNGAGKKLWGYHKATDTWIPLQVDVNGKVIVDMSAISLGDLADVRVPAPADQNFLYWDATAGEWTYRPLLDADIPAGIARDAEVVNAVAAEAIARDLAIAAIVLNDLADVNAPAPADRDIIAWDVAASKWITRARLTPITAALVYYQVNVSNTPHTATISAVAGDVITLTAAVADTFFKINMTGNVYLKIANTSKIPVEYAWVKDRPAGNQLKVTVAADIAGWVNGETITTAYDGVASNEIDIDLSPIVPAGTAYVYGLVQASDAVNAGANACFSSPSLAVHTYTQVAGVKLRCYGFVALDANRRYRVRIRGASANGFTFEGWIYAYSQ